MGFDIQRFPNDVYEELICSICGGVLQDPIQISTCEHTFCRTCIEEWLLFSPTKTCPVDRTLIEINQTKLVPRILKNLLNRMSLLIPKVEKFIFEFRELLEKILKNISTYDHAFSLDIKCENEGCTAIVKLEVLASHHADCAYNKKISIECEHGCGMIIVQDNYQSHNCIQALSNELHYVKKELEKYKTDVEFYKTELLKLQDYIRISHINDSTISYCLERVDNDEVSRWSTSLQLAHINHWGGMISTPDIVLKNSIKDALIESGCPIRITKELMENAHEQRWPEGLSTLETRQLNRQHYDSYICRRIVDEQAVVVLSCDNQHMNPSMSRIT